MKIFVAFIAMFFAITGLAVIAQENETAEDLVQNMERADMSYLQLMEIMGAASAMMHEGVIRENQQMVKMGANIILTHPAPSDDPWSIMHDEDQAGFKASLVSFDKLLDEYTLDTAEAAENKDWMNAITALQKLNATCISCHSSWKHKVL